MTLKANDAIVAKFGRFKNAYNIIAEFEFSEDDRTNHKIHSVVSDLLYLRFSDVFMNE